MPLVSPALLPNLTTLRNLLEIISTLRNLSDPFSSADSLRRSIDMLLQLAETLNLNAKWTAWVRTIRENPELLNLILAAGHYLETLLEPAPQTKNNISIQSLNLQDLLTLLSELIQLLEHLGLLKQTT
jgi:hypothetical protein